MSNIVGELRLRPKGRAGSALALALIVLLILAGGVFFLVHLRHQSETEGKEFARKVIQKCAFEHDPVFLTFVFAADRRWAVPRATDDQFIATLKQLGVPESNYSITGELQFDRYVGAPRGVFKAILTFPDRHGTMFVSVERPSGIWLVADYGILWERPPN